MIKLSEIIYNLKGIIRDNKSDDVKITNRQLEFMINYVRARLIRQDVNKNRPISENIIQPLGVIPVNLVNATDVPGINTKILRTSVKIPKPIEVADKDLILYVGGTDGLNGFDIVSKAQAKWSKYNKYTKCGKRAYYRNGYIYLSGADAKVVDSIYVEGVWENPREVALFTANGDYCYDINVDGYPLSMHMIETINELLMGKEFTMMLQLSEDYENNASDKN